MTKRRVAKRVAIAVLGLLLLIQLVPYGRSHANPPVTGTPHWDNATTARLVQGACMDCHSNLTHWRWYSNIAPASWLVQNDVDGARKRLDFSEWDRAQPSVNEVVDAIESGSMPPLQYKLIHPAARLSQAERAQLEQGLAATYAADPPAAIRHSRGD
jgi:Haem-binding domain